MKREYWTLLFIFGGFLLAGYVETHEPTPHYAQVECHLCHMPNLNSYKAYAQAWPSTAEMRNK